jgi:predicted transcriptional regulator
VSSPRDLPPLARELVEDVLDGTMFVKRETTASLYHELIRLRGRAGERFSKTRPRRFEHNESGSSRARDAVRARRTPMTDSRYKIIMRNGRSLRVRDRKMLRADVLELILESDEGLARKRIADAVGAQMNMVGQVLEDLLAAGEIDRYQARRPGRNRDDTFWCRVGFVAAKRVNRYHGAATLAAFQAAALMMLRGNARV